MLTTFDLAEPPPSPSVTSRRPTTFRLAILLAVTAFAFHASLAALAATLGGQTPLAYSGLVPLFAVGIAAARWSAAPFDGEATSSHDLRSGVACLLVSSVVLVSPELGLTAAWAARLDLISLPIFVVGAVLVLFGRRVARGQRLALAFLALMWPLPYTEVLIHLLRSFSAVTVAAVGGLVHLIPVARRIGPGGSAFVTRGHRSINIDVAATCSGISSFFGFLLLGGAASVLLEGRRLRKAVWVVTGLATSWLFNLVRILVIFGAAGEWGRHLALDVIHPFAGIVLFTLNTVLLAAGARLVGLRWRDPTVVGPRRVPADRCRSGSAAVPLSVLVAVLIVFALVASAGDGGIVRFDPISGFGASSTNAPAAPASLAGYRVVSLTDEQWAKPFFGDSSTWARYLAASQSEPSVRFSLETIDSSDRAALSEYGVNAYLGGFRVRSAKVVSVGAHVRGVLLAPFGRTDVVVWCQRVSSGRSPRYREFFLAAAPGSPQSPADLLSDARSLVDTPQPGGGGASK